MVQTPGAGVCPQCGEWSEPWDVPGERGVMNCPRCGYESPFLRLPLFVITGASGSGKTDLGQRLIPELREECVVIDKDLLWRNEYNDHLGEFNALWLRLARQIGQAGLPVVLYGTTIPEQIEALGERRYFSSVHYLALVCDDADLEARLRRRPGWRGSSDPAFVSRMRELNMWIRQNAAMTTPPMTVLDTSAIGTEDMTARAASWVREALRGPRKDD